MFFQKKFTTKAEIKKTYYISSHDNLTITPKTIFFNPLQANPQNGQTH